VALERSQDPGFQEFFLLLVFGFSPWEDFDRMGRSRLKIEVDDIKVYNPQSAVEAARFQHDRGFGFQPNGAIIKQDSGR
jgi:hypothetical protein